MTKIPLPPTSYTVTEQVVYLAQQLKSAGGYDDLVRLLMATEKKERPRRGARRVKRVHVATRYGTKAKGGAGWVSGELLDEAMKGEGR